MGVFIFSWPLLCSYVLFLLWLLRRSQARFWWHLLLCTIFFVDMFCGFYDGPVPFFSQGGRFHNIFKVGARCSRSAPHELASPRPSIVAGNLDFGSCCNFDGLFEVVLDTLGCKTNQKKIRKPSRCHTPSHVQQANRVLCC